jgi:hypothetical protein
MKNIKYNVLKFFYVQAETYRSPPNSNKASDACVYAQLNLSTSVIAASTMYQASDVFDNTYAIRK